MNRIAVLMIACVALPQWAQAQVPERVSYQGRLLKSDGTPEQGVVTVVFNLYAGATEATALWTEAQQVALSDGYYAVHLGDVEPIPASLFDGTERYLELSIGGAPLRPRHRLVTVPYAFRAGRAEVAGSSEDTQALVSQLGAGGTLNAAGNPVDWTQLKNVPTATDSQPGIMSAADHVRLTAAAPTGAVMFFNLAACPAGWSALVNAQGRYLVGLNPGGLLAHREGTKLVDQENRPTGQHNHPVNDPGHTHNVAVARQTGNNRGNGGLDHAVDETRATASSTTGVTVANSAGTSGVAGTNAPYMQLLVCQRN